MNNLFVIFIFIPAISGIISQFIFYKFKKLSWVLFLIISGFLGYNIIQLYGHWDLVSTLNLNIGFLSNHALTLKLTPFGWFFCTISLIITFIFSIFSLSYNDKKHITGVAPLWTILLAANSGIFLSGDYIMLFIVWELMSWTSFFIISHGKERAFKAGIYYFALSMLGTASFIIAIFMISYYTGTFDIQKAGILLSNLFGKHSIILYLIISFLVITFFTKSAIFPFYMWPSKAHAEAPDDFSAFLSGIMIKYGVYAFLVIIIPIFANGKFSGITIGGNSSGESGISLYMYIIAWLGAITGVIGTIRAIIEIDMKKLMAYSTVANLGYIITAFAIGSAIGITGGIFHAFSHMLFKGAIFLTLAAVKYRTGERDMHRLGGLAYRMPITFFVFLISIIAAASIPPTIGFSSKWLLYQAIFQKHLVFIGIAGFFTTTGSFLYLYRALHSIFLGQLSPRFNNVKEAPLLQLFPMLIMLFAIFIFGMFPGIITNLITSLQQLYGYPIITSTYTTITGFSSKINFFSVGLSFIIAAALVFILYLISAKRNKVNMMDNYTAGESPEDWGITPEKYHYAYLFSHPFREVFLPFVDKIDIDSFYVNVHSEIKRLGNAMVSFYEKQTNFILVSSIAILLITLLLWNMG